MRERHILWSGFLLLVTLLTGPAAQAQDRDALPKYQPVAGVAGTLSIQSGDMPGNLAAAWLDAFRRYYPDVTVALGDQGSSAASAALIDSSDSVAVMSRPMSEQELLDYEIRHSDRLRKAIILAHSAILIYANQASPVRQVTLPQLDAMFSSTRRCSDVGAIRHWRQLGVKGRLADAALRLFGQDDSAGVSELFRQRVLCNGDLRPGVDQLAGASAVQAAVAANEDGLGFADLGPKLPGVKTLAVAANARSRFIKPSAANIRSGLYPLSHAIVLYAYRDADMPLPPAVREFIKLALSAEGQKIAKEMGYLPLSATEVHQKLEQLR